MLTPIGPKGLLYAFEVSDMRFALSVIREWQSPNFQTPQPLELSLMVAAAAVLSTGASACQLKDDGDNLVAGKAAQPGR